MTEEVIEPARVWEDVRIEEGDEGGGGEGTGGVAGRGGTFGTPPMDEDRPGR
jgi:hypothetical protein